VSVEASDRLLERGELEVLGLLPRASNATFLARAHEGGGELLVVYKPRAGETPLWDFDEGTLGRREVAAYRLSRALGWPTIPPTVLRDGPHGPGMVQRFVRFDPTEHFFTLRDRRPDDFRRIALFDAVANNADRKAGHCLLAESGEIVCIDHGVCFHEEPKLRTVIWDFAGEPIEPELTRDLRALAAALHSDGLRVQLAPLLSPEELDALEDRLDRLLAEGRYPEPGLERPFPWPPV
jgi:uncharacterized repeat protein (TIGR03843 family)